MVLNCPGGATSEAVQAAMQMSVADDRTNALLQMLQELVFGGFGHSQAVHDLRYSFYLIHSRQQQLPQRRIESGFGIYEYHEAVSSFLQAPGDEQSSYVRRKFRGPS